MGALADLRGRVVDVLEPLDADWTVYPAAVDAIEPPAFLCGWADPWTVPATHGVDTARLEILVLAARVEPDIPTLELMVEFALAALAVAGFRATTIPPAPLEIAGVPYLAARITLEYPVTFSLPEVP